MWVGLTNEPQEKHIVEGVFFVCFKQRLRYNGDKGGGLYGSEKNGC